MFDLNAVFNTAIAQAVDSHVRGLVAAQDLQTQALEQMQIRLNDMTQRLESLSASLNGQLGQQVNQDLLQQLDKAEWFWGRIADFVSEDLRKLVEEVAEEAVTDDVFMRKLTRLLNFDDVVSNALDNIDMADKLDLKGAVENALDDIDLVDSLDEDALVDKLQELLKDRDWIKDAVNALSFTISVE